MPLEQLERLAIIASSLGGPAIVLALGRRARKTYQSLEALDQFPAQLAKLQSDVGVAATAALNVETRIVKLITDHVADDLRQFTSIQENAARYNRDVLETLSKMALRLPTKRTPAHNE